MSNRLYWRLILGGIVLSYLLLALSACAAGPNEKPRWKAYRLEVRP